MAKATAGERFCMWASISAAVERWLRMPHHYSLSAYLNEFDARAATDAARGGAE